MPSIEFSSLPEITGRLDTQLGSYFMVVKIGAILLYIYILILSGKYV